MKKIWRLNTFNMKKVRFYYASNKDKDLYIKKHKEFILTLKKLLRKVSKRLLKDKKFSLFFDSLKKLLDELPTSIKTKKKSIKIIKQEKNSFKDIGINKPQAEFIDKTQLEFIEQITKVADLNLESQFILNDFLKKYEFKKK